MNRQNTVMIVDDKDINRDFLVELLRDDYDILEASNGVEAMELLDDDNNKISAVILDIVMPVMDGYEVLENMRQKQYLPRIPVIVTTIDGDEESEIKALSMGASDFLRKPYNPVIVQKRLENIISLTESSALINHLQKDRLTGVYTIEHFNDKVSRCLSEKTDEQYAIVYSDMENFQLLKDLYNEDTGDSLLVYMAKVLRYYLKNGEYCGRMEADHFVLFVKYDKKRIEDMLEEVVRLVNEYPVKMNMILHFGIYIIDNKNISVHAMCNRAILPLESIKGQYGKHIAYYTEDILEKQIREQEILNCMEDAIKEQQFQVYFQPKYELNSEVVAGAEADRKSVV